MNRRAVVVGLAVGILVGLGAVAFGIADAATASRLSVNAKEFRGNRALCPMDRGCVRP